MKNTRNKINETQKENKLPIKQMPNASSGVILLPESKVQGFQFKMSPVKVIAAKPRAKKTEFLITEAFIPCLLNFHQLHFTIPSCSQSYFPLSTSWANL